MLGKKIGLVIGNNYPNSNKELRFAVADAKKIKEILENKDICGFDEVVYLPNRTSEEVRGEIEKNLNSSENDLVFIYFSGHGKKDFENELCLLFNDTEDSKLLTTSLNFDFINKCRRYPSKKSVIIILDCCYSGLAGIRGEDTDIVETLKNHSGSGTVIITSTGLTGSPTAKEDEGLGHGIFTNYLIEGLEEGLADINDDGYISIKELYDYAFEKTKGKCSQSPKMEGSLEGSIFIGINSQKIRIKEYESKKKKLFDEFSDKLPSKIFGECQIILRKQYKNPSHLDSIERIVLGSLESLLKGDLSPEKHDEAIQNCIEAVQHFIDINRKPEKPDILRTFNSPSTNIEFILIPAGEFMMGSGESDNEIPVHKVIIKSPFYMGKYLVTQKQWKIVMGNNPSYFQGENRPVECVSWNEIQEFIKKLNEKEDTDKYRLPSEAEWEYACRAGTKTKYFFGDDKSKLKDYAWCAENSSDKLYLNYKKLLPLVGLSFFVPVVGSIPFYSMLSTIPRGETQDIGQKKPNPWKLYDMYGNVKEWVQDKWHENYYNAPSDGSSFEIGDCPDSVTRSCNWKIDAEMSSSSSRGYCSHKTGFVDLGFRLVRDL